MFTGAGEEEGGEPEIKRGNSLNKKIATDARFFTGLEPGR